MGRSRQSTAREKKDLGHVPTLGSVGGCFGVLLRLDWSIPTKIVGFVKPHEGVI